MARLLYAVKEAFLTLQGEGRWAGHRAVFVRFSGCNVWSGREKDRERDTAKGCCAAWCDTNFAGVDGPHGGHYTRSDLVALVVGLWARPVPPDSPLVTSGGSLAGGAQRGLGEPIVVFTGGEPGLQLDGALVKAMRAAGVRVHVESNGSHALPADIDWICISPKPPMPVVQAQCDELKVVFPAVDPLSLAIPPGAALFVQPQDSLDHDEAANNITDAIDFVMAHPQWALSLQTHKILELP